MEGSVTLRTDLETRPVMQSLSAIKQAVKTAFRGVDTGGLQTSIKQVSTDIKKLESESAKARNQLDALMSGEKTPQSIKELERDLANTEKQLDKMSKGYDKMLAEVDKYRDYEGLSIRSFPEAQKFQDAQSALERYEAEWVKLEEKAEKFRLVLDKVKAHPELTVEAQRYGQKIAENSTRLGGLRKKYEELSASIQRANAINTATSNNFATSVGRINHRLAGLVKRIFFFGLFTMALRKLRSQISALISSDSQLSASLAQVKGNLATAFGTIFTAALPAIRTLVSWLAKATAYLAAFISWLTGKSFKVGRDAFENANKSAAGVAGNTGKIGKAAKKAAKEAQRMLLPFDQMNVLTKDSAKGAGGGGGGGAGGGGGVGGITWPKEMDDVIAKFEKFRDLILLIAAAFAAWRLSKLASQLLGISRIKAFVGLTSLITGITLLVTGIRDLIKNGPSVKNVCDIIAGALLTVGGAVLLLTGATGIGLLLIALGALVLVFKNLYQNCETFRNAMNTIGRVIKKIFGGLWGQLKESAQELKKSFSGSGVFFKVLKTGIKQFHKIGQYIILGILKGQLYVIKKLGSWIKKNILTPFIKKVKKVFGIASPAKEMLSIGKDIMLGVLEGMLEPIKKIGNWVKDHILEPIRSAFSGNTDDEGFSIDISAKFADTKETIAEKWDEITSGIKEKVATIWSEVKEKVKGAIEALKESWETVKDKTATLWAEVKEKVAGAVEALQAKWDDIKDTTATLYTEVKEKVAGAIASVKNTWVNLNGQTATLYSAVTEKAKGMLDKVQRTFSYGGKKLTATLTTAVKGVKAKTLISIANALGKIKWGNKVLNATINLKAAVASGYNKIADKINGFLGKLPKAVQPSWRLPKLAKGAVIPANKEFLAMLGDQKRGVNIETPLETMIEAFNTALQANGYNGAPTVNVYLQGDAKQLFRVVRTEANNYTQSTGKAAFNI